MFCIHLLVLQAHTVPRNTGRTKHLPLVKTRMQLKKHLQYWKSEKMKQVIICKGNILYQLELRFLL